MYSHSQVEFEQEKHMHGDPDIRAEIEKNRRKRVAKAASARQFDLEIIFEGLSIELRLSIRT